MTKEKVSYEEEALKTEEKVEKMKSENKDEYEIKKMVSNLLQGQTRQVLLHIKHLIIFSLNNKINCIPSLFWNSVNLGTDSIGGFKGGAVAPPSLKFSNLM